MSAAEKISPDVEDDDVRILIVEDNLVNRLVIKTLLEPISSAVDFAENGAIAVDAMREKTFELVLMDINMPVMDGVTATIEIRKHEQENDVDRTPIVAVTAHDDMEHRLACEEAGMDGFVAKPIKADLLFDSIHPYIEGRRADAHG